MPQPLVHIVLVNWNHFQDTIECIESLNKITYPNFHIIVVDNGSDNDSVSQIESKFPFVISLPQKDNLGFAHGNNIGREYAIKNGAEYVLFLNNDTLVDPDFLSKMVQRAELDSQIGAVGARIYFQSDPSRVWWAGGKLNIQYGEIFNLGYGQLDQTQSSLPIEVNYIVGCCVLVPTEILKIIGDWDESYFHTGEDVDLSLRIVKAGYQLWVEPQAEIWHKVGMTGGSELNPGYLYYLERNRLWLVKRFSGWQGWHSWLKLVPLMVKRLVGIAIKSRNVNSVWALILGWNAFRSGETGQRK